jgi:flagellar biosynthesis/type III secretory pathway protein FliH
MTESHFEKFEQSDAFTIQEDSRPAVVIQDLPSGESQSVKKYSFTNFKKDLLPGSFAAADAQLVLEKKQQGFQVTQIVADALNLEAAERLRLTPVIEEEVHKRMLDLQDLAYEQGFAQGLIDGQKESQLNAQEKADAHLQKFLQLVDAINGCLPQLLAINEHFLIEMVMLLVSKLVLQKIKVDPEYLVQVLRAMFERLEVRDGITIKLSTADEKSLEFIEPKVLFLLPEKTGVKFIFDPALAPGEVQVVTEFSQLRASAEQNLQRVEQNLFAAVSYE